MPPLRKSRAPFHRASTTPFASPTGTPSDSTSGAKRQSLVTEWTEPIPQALAPSFEEHGFARHGVLETMAPLGVLPSAKVKQRTRAMGETAARNAAFGKGAAAFGDDVGSTPEVTPAPELEPNDSERQEEDEMQVEFPLHEEEEDDDYEPTKSKKKAKVSKTPVRGKTPVPGKTPVLGRTPIRNGSSKAASVSASLAVQPVPSLAPTDLAAAQRLQSAVNDAMIRSIKENNRQVGNALNEMLEESKTDSTLAVVLDAVMHQNMSNEQWGTFRAYVKRSRKRQRNAAKMKRLQEGDAGRRAAHIYGNSTFSQRPSSRASSEVVPDDSVSAIHDLSYQNDAAPSVSRPSHTAAGVSFTPSLQHRSSHPRSRHLWRFHPKNTVKVAPEEACNEWPRCAWVNCEHKWRILHDSTGFIREHARGRRWK
jgi:hypothetical protein